MREEQQAAAIATLCGVLPLRDKASSSDFWPLFRTSAGAGIGMSQCNGNQRYV